MEFATPGSTPAQGLMQDSYPVFERLYEQER